MIYCDFCPGAYTIDAGTPKTNPLTFTRHTNFRYGCAGLDPIYERDGQL
jgi:hypothetical protein